MFINGFLIHAHLRDINKSQKCISVRNIRSQNNGSDKESLVDHSEISNDIRSKAKVGIKFKERETTQVENLILVGTFLLWAIL